MKRPVLFIAWVFFAGCTSSDSPSDAGAASDAARQDTGGGDSGAEDTGAADAGTDGSVADSGAPACPAAPPAAGGPCTREGLACEYGMRSCLTLAQCSGGQWLVAEPDCLPPPAGGCPASREAAEGTGCPGDDGAVCDFDMGLLCRCTTCPIEFPICMVVDPPVWACEAPNPDPVCPPAQALLGTACSLEDLLCEYGCEPNQARRCTDGVWVRDSSPGGCPMSTRRAKRDIEYLDETQVNELAAAAMSTRLTTYEYTDPAMAGRRRLGFIIEDQPASYAVDPERSQVDLYGYTSMLVAAMQAQERRIEALEEELRELRRQR